MARRQRKDQYILNISGPQADLETASTTDTCVQEVVSTSIDTIQRAVIENSQQTAEDGGLETIQGLWHTNINAPIETYCEGTRAVAAYEAAPNITGLSHLLAAVCQSEPVDTIRSKATGVPTATSIVEDKDDGHAIAGGYATAQIGQVLTFKTVGSVYDFVPYTYTAGTDTLSMLMATNGALAANDVLYGGINHQYCEQYDIPNPYAITIDWIANDDLQNFKTIGSVCSLSIPAVSAADVPKLNFTVKAAGGAYTVSASRPTAAYQRPKVFAGSKIRMAIYGQTAATNICGTYELSVASSWVADTCPSSAYGIQNWARGANSTEVKVVLPHYVKPSDLTTGASTSWLAALDNGVDTLVHLQAVYGQFTPGSAFAVYHPALRLSKVDRGELDGRDANILTFKPAAEYAKAVPASVFTQA